MVHTDECKLLLMTKLTKYVFIWKPPIKRIQIARIQTKLSFMVYLMVHTKKGVIYVPKECKVLSSVWSNMFLKYIFKLNFKVF